MTFKFTAESWSDVLDLVGLLPRNEILYYRVHEFTDRISHVEMTMELKTFTLAQLKHLMRQVEEGTVMVQTVTLVKQYIRIRKPH